MRGGRADRHRPALLYTYIYGEASGSCRARFGGVCNTPLPCRSIVFIQMGRGATAYAPSDVPGKGTNAGARLFRRVICLGRPGSIVPVCGAYAIRPYPDGRLFSSKWVGRNSIRPIRRPRQGDGGGCPVVSQGDLFRSSGPYRARLWGVCCCAPTLTVDCMGSFCQSSDLDAP